MNQQILQWDNKYGSTFYDASTPEKEAAAFLRMFQDMDEQGFYQYDAEEDEKKVKELLVLKELMEKGQVPAALIKDAQDKLGWLSYYEKQLKAERTQKTLYDKAKQGDAKAARKLVDLRCGEEYESWSLEEVIDPLVLKEKEDDA